MITQVHDAQDVGRCSFRTVYFIYSLIFYHTILFIFSCFFPLECKISYILLHPLSRKPVLSSPCGQKSDVDEGQLAASSYIQITLPTSISGFFSITDATVTDIRCIFQQTKPSITRKNHGPMLHSLHPGCRSATSDFSLIRSPSPPDPFINSMKRSGGEDDDLYDPVQLTERPKIRSR